VSERVRCEGIFVEPWNKPLKMYTQRENRHTFISLEFEFKTVVGDFLF
jgi:hypothetical protein